MGSYGRTGRKRKRKRDGNYQRELGAAVFEPGYIELLKWAKRNGISFGKLRPAYFRQTGRGLMTCRKLSEGELVISVPEKMLITTKTAERSQILETFIKIQPKHSLTTIQILCVFILYEKFQRESSFWYPYITTLPTSFNTPAYFKPEELSTLPSSLQQQCVTQIQTVRDSYEELKGYLEYDTTMLDKTFLDFLTFDEFRWAWFVVNTRSVYKANSMDLSPSSKSQMQDNYALAPVLDLLNHNDMAEVQAGFNQESKHYEISTLTPYKKGAQVFINYGPHDNRKLLLEYGFILPQNLHNTVAFSEDLIYSVVLPDIFGISRRKREIIAVNDLHKDLCCSEGSGLSWNLLVLLRILAMKEDHLKRHWQRVLTGEFLGEDVENRVLQWRQCLIEKVLVCNELDEKDIAKCLSSDTQQSENVKLALSLRNQEKQILQNALDMIKIPG
ncbi:SET domain-containing protein 4-like [Stylophora pistillata]|uniref:SET domain-containing protein 4 n=1 Tax=Stylophora pistillata TaxID=50429 RepID=A0A2B4RKY9_STYPI|nr:SET domain-containing protein 4-like [Stylophora pistillata]PFX16912.1 SET domain-containing protein 4 [Stylophora pistillata]